MNNSLEPYLEYVLRHPTILLRHVFGNILGGVNVFPVGAQRVRRRGILKLL